MSPTPRNTRNLLCVVVATAALLGCANISMHTGKEEIVKNEDSLRNQAGFQMSCPPKDLVVVRLSPERSDSAGVSGCGQRAIYKYISHGPGWMANSATTEPSSNQ